MFPMHATCVTHLILNHFITLIVQVMKLLIMHFSLTSPILGPNILPSTLLSVTLYLSLILTFSRLMTYIYVVPHR
jgi:hypothetical protein